MKINLSQVSEIREYYQSMANNPYKWAKFEGIKSGMDWLTKSFQNSFAPIFLYFKDP